MQLNGVAITSPKLYRDNFSFKDVYEIMSLDLITFEQFQEEYLPSETKIILFSWRNLDGSKHTATPAALIAKPECCAEYFPQLFEKQDGGQFVICQKAMRSYCHDAYKNMEDRSPAIPWLGDEQMNQAVANLLAQVTHNNQKAAFSAPNAAMIFIYLLLHLQIGLSPMNEDSFGQLRDLCGSMAQQPTADSGTAPDGANSPVNLGNMDSKITLNGANGPVNLGTLYTGSKDDAGPMEIVELRCEGSAGVTVFIGNSPLVRRLKPGEKLYAVRRGGRFISFLPRFATVGDTVLLMVNGQLCVRCRGLTQIISTRIGNPACWAHTNSYGTFILDHEGRLDSEICAPADDVKQPAVSVSAMGPDYCLLLADGTVKTAIGKTGWDHLIHVAVGLNSAIAIRADRRPILASGKVIDFKDAVDAQAYNEHYICLNAQGGVLTDSGLTVEDAEAIAICNRGYVIARQKEVELYDFKTKRVGTAPLSVKEMTATDQVLVYYDDNSGTVKIDSMEKAFAM